MCGSQQSIIVDKLKYIPVDAQSLENQWSMSNCSKKQVKVLMGPC